MMFNNFLSANYEHIYVKMNSTCLLCALVTIAGLFISWSHVHFIVLDISYSQV